jgi:hypothetical protein
MLKLEARPEPSAPGPMLAVAGLADHRGHWHADVCGAGQRPGAGLEMFFWLPINSAYAWGELLVKATPLLIIALGLAVCFRSNVWNIGAEGQYIMGAICGRWRGPAGRPGTGGWIVCRSFWRACWVACCGRASRAAA